ncbi:MAG: hypothetical protein PWP51_1320 [Clostridiales bacterium]|jgi:hypothetical protein|nr:hypothetical protein [Clostridiales bacterium]MDN5298767.1 hypothetical protein [Clostridiales bacterium]
MISKRFDVCGYIRETLKGKGAEVRNAHVITIWLVC